VHFKRGKTYSFVAIFYKMLPSELVKLFLISKEAQRGGEKKLLGKKGKSNNNFSFDLCLFCCSTGAVLLKIYYI